MFAALLKNKGALKGVIESNSAEGTNNNNKSSTEDLDSLLIHSRHNLQAQQQQKGFGGLGNNNNIVTNTNSAISAFAPRGGTGTTSRGRSPPQNLLLQQQQKLIPLSPELTQVFQTVEWDPEIYGVGVRSIDEQHQTLISTITNLCNLGKSVAQNLLNPSIAASPSSPTKKAAPPSSSSSPESNKLGASVTSPMTLRGALGLEMKKFEEKEENNKNGKSSSQEDNKNDNNSSKDRRKSTASSNNEDSSYSNNNNYNNIKSSNHVFGHRVTLAEGACRTIDRGHPPDFQKGGKMEPLILALVNHCSAKLIQEEHALEAVSFSDRGPHAAEHQIFVREVFRAHQMMESYNLEMSDLVKLIKFLKSWIKDHIPKDRRYAPLMLEKQSSLAAGKVV